jgi:type II secretory ATPase GspE/PulE/Tfp pilus assembly ATPase PilB-like protein
MNSNQSYFITGPGGSGKTTLLKQLQAELTKQDKNYITLCDFVSYQSSSLIGWWDDYS